jgi:hypothetical protein
LKCYTPHTINSLEYIGGNNKWKLPVTGIALMMSMIMNAQHATIMENATAKTQKRVLSLSVNGKIEKCGGKELLRKGKRNE